jgi:hypothetical protein
MKRFNYLLVVLLSMIVVACSNTTVNFVKFAPSGVGGVNINADDATFSTKKDQKATNDVPIDADIPVTSTATEVLKEVLPDTPVIPDQANLEPIEEPEEWYRVDLTNHNNDFFFTWFRFNKTQWKAPIVFKVPELEVYLVVEDPTKDYEENGIHYRSGRVASVGEEHHGGCGELGCTSFILPISPEATYVLVNQPASNWL